MKGYEVYTYTQVHYTPTVSRSMFSDTERLVPERHDWMFGESSKGQRHVYAPVFSVSYSA